MYKLNLTLTMNLSTLCGNFVPHFFLFRESFRPPHSRSRCKSWKLLEQGAFAMNYDELYSAIVVISQKNDTNTCEVTPEKKEHDPLPGQRSSRSLGGKRKTRINKHKPMCIFLCHQFVCLKAIWISFLSCLCGLCLTMIPSRIPPSRAKTQR